MKIRSCSYNIFFPVMPNLRELVFEFEKNLSDFVKPFNLMPVPNEAPAEIPRITAVSEHGHSSLVVTAQNAVITANFDNKFWCDFDKCFKYIEEKRDSLISAYNQILKPKTGTNIFFSGLSTQVEFDEKETIDPVEFIYDKFVKIKSNQKRQDVLIRFTHVLRDSLYINMEIQNVRLFSGTQFGSLMSTAGLKQQSHSMFVNLDVNDRYSYNLKPNYVTNEEKIKEIFSVSKCIVSEKLHTLIIKGGDLDYDS